MHIVWFHTHPKDGHWKFRVGGGLSGQNFKESYEAKLEILRGEGKTLGEI